MALDMQDIARIDALMAALGAGAGAGSGADHLREGLARLLPGLGQRSCDVDDVLEEPFRQLGAIGLHLLDTSGHCIRLTTDPAEATALLLATPQELRA
ncbi:MAG TPA: hypothetical protein VFF98_13975 [Novosphingobium sp.]|nr:hypothetical protein [Novosphingobium sp.]